MDCLQLSIRICVCSIEPILISVLLFVAECVNNLTQPHMWPAYRQRHQVNHILVVHWVILLIPFVYMCDCYCNLAKCFAW